jgi:hypothetical protein
MLNAHHKQCSTRHCFVAASSWNFSFICIVQYHVMGLNGLQAEVPAAAYCRIAAPSVYLQAGLFAAEPQIQARACTGCRPVLLLLGSACVLDWQ